MTDQPVTAPHDVEDLATVKLAPEPQGVPQDATMTDISEPDLPPIEPVSK